MRKSIWTVLLVAAVTLLAAGCAKEQDLKSLQEKVDGLDTRVTALEQAVKKINDETVPGLQNLVKAIEKKLTVVNVVEGDGEYTILFSDGTSATIKDGAKGEQGKSAYDVAVENGFQGTLEEWLASLKGETGASGTNGKSAYELAVEKGYEGTLEEWLASLKGEAGVNGTNGKSAYELAVEKGYTGTLDEWLTSLKGADGVNGVTPTVSIYLKDDVWVWLINGEVAVDGDGNPIPVVGPKGEEGVTPQFAVMADPNAADPGTADKYWCVSYDNGQSWKLVTLASIDGFATAYIDTEAEDDDNIYLVIGTTRVPIPKEKAFVLKFSFGDDNGVNEGETVDFAYTIEGVSATDETDVDVIGIIGGWDAEVVAADNKSGVVKVTNNGGTAKITVLAANHRGKMDYRTLKFEGGVLTAVIETSPVPGTGGDFELTVTANQSYAIRIPEEAQSWISVAKDTRAVHTDNLKITVESNETASYRSATVSVVNTSSNEVVKEIEIFQYPNSAVPTSIASLAALQDGTKAEVYNVTIIASTNVSALAVSGEEYLYIKTDVKPTVGSVVNLTGVKNTEEENLIFEAETVTVAGEAVEIPEPDPVITYETPADFSCVGIVGYTSTEEDILSLKVELSKDSYIVDASDVEVTNDMRVLLKGYAAGNHFLPLSSKDIPYVEEKDWAYTWEGIYQNKYPVVRRSVAEGSTAGKFLQIIETAENVQNYGLESIGRAYLLNQITENFSGLTNGDSFSYYSALVDKDVYFIALGMDEEGYVNGKYSVLHVNNAYTSLGTGSFREDFYTGWYTEVEIMQHNTYPQYYKVVKPYGALWADAEYTPSGDVSGPEDLYLAVRNEGEPFFPLWITALAPEDGLVVWPNYMTGYYYSVYGEETAMDWPGMWSSMRTQNYTHASRVLSYQANGNPSNIQLAPVYLWETAGRWNTRNAMANDHIRIVFPGCEPLDFSVALEFLSREGDQATVSVTLGESVEYANVALASTLAEAQAALANGQGVTVSESGNVVLALTASKGTFYVAYDSYYQDEVFASDNIKFSLGAAEPSEKYLKWVGSWTTNDGKDTWVIAADAYDVSYTISGLFGYNFLTCSAEYNEEDGSFSIMNAQVAYGSYMLYGLYSTETNRYYLSDDGIPILTAKFDSDEAKTATMTGGTYNSYSIDGYYLSGGNIVRALPANLTKVEGTPSSVSTKDTLPEVIRSGKYVLKQDDFPGQSAQPYDRQDFAK